MYQTNNDTEPGQPQDTAVKCQCGKYKTIRPVYYEVDVNQFIINDWD